MITSLITTALLSLSSSAPEPPWDALAECESGGNWSLNDTFDGGLQFHPVTWEANGGDEFADFAYQATREQQIIVAERVLASQGWDAWPGCSAQLGLSGGGSGGPAPETPEPAPETPAPEQTATTEPVFVTAIDQYGNEVLVNVSAGELPPGL